MAQSAEQTTLREKAPARVAQGRRAAKISQRNRTTRTILRRLEAAPPLTAEQKLAILDAAYQLTVLDQQQAS